MQRGSHAGKAGHCSWAPQSQSYRFVSNTVKRPVVTSVLGASGVIIGHTGWAPSRKCDPAALGLCVAQRLPSGTSVTAPIQLRITFVVLFFVSIVYGHLCLNKGTAPSIWHFCRCCLETVRQASTWCFSSWFLFSQEFKSSWVTDAAGIHKFFWKHFHERFVRFSYSRVPEMWCFSFLKSNLYSSE